MESMDFMSGLIKNSIFTNSYTWSNIAYFAETCLKAMLNYTLRSFLIESTFWHTSMKELFLLCKDILIFQF